MTLLAQTVADLGEKLLAEGQRDAATVLIATAAMLMDQNTSGLDRLSNAAAEIALARMTAHRAMDN